MAYKTIYLEDKWDIAILKLNFPQKLNCLSTIFFDEFDHAIEQISSNKDFRVLMLIGCEDVFSAGGDLREIGAADYEKSLLMCIRVQKSFSSLLNLDIPVVAALRGLVYGGGLELALHCDIRFADTSCVLRLPEADMGLIPGAGGISILSKYLTPGDAALYLFTGNEIPLQDAYNKGLIQNVLQENELMDYSLNFCKTLTDKSYESLAAIKKTLYTTIFSGLEDGLDMETKEFSSVLQKSGKKKIKDFFDNKKLK